MAKRLTEFPEIQRGGSLMLAWQVKKSHVLVVGGGEVAAGRVYNLLCADAEVTVICPRSGLNKELAHRLTRNEIRHVDRTFCAEDLEEPAPAMVLTAIDDQEISTQIYQLCRAKKIAANIADIPSECDFYFGSVHRDGPLQIMVSTNGNGPKLANIVRKRIAEGLPSNAGSAIEKVGLLRKKLRTIAPTSIEGPKRMGWMSKVCESWSLNDLSEMDERDMDQLLKFYSPNEVPSLDEVRSREDITCAFRVEKSIGWDFLI